MARSSNIARGDYSCRRAFRNTARTWKSMNSVPRHRLVIVVYPCCEVGVGICFDVLADVGLGREVRWFAADVLPPFRLIHTHVVNLHVHRERYVFKINETEVFGHSQIDDNILEQVFNDRNMPLHGNGAYHRFLGDRPSRNLHQRIRSHTGG